MPWKSSDKQTHQRSSFVGCLPDDFITRCFLSTSQLDSQIRLDRIWTMVPMWETRWADYFLLLFTESGPIGGRRDKQRRSFDEFRKFILIINRMRTSPSLLDELFHVSPVRDVLEVLFAVLLLVHVQQVSGTAVSGTTLWFLELMRQFWKWNVPISH